jgi:hypothetical protein
MQDSKGGKDYCTFLPVGVGDKLLEHCQSC